MAFENTIRMTEQALEPLKGWTANMNCLDFNGELDSSITDRVGPGAVVSLNPDGKLILGVGNDAVMPMFTFHASTSAGVINSAPSPSNPNRPWAPVTGRGKMVFLVAVGGYELQSTNYVAGSYPRNTHLTSPKDGDNAGKLTTGVVYTNTICGVVSQGVVANAYSRNISALCFWPVYIPPVPGD